MPAVDFPSAGLTIGGPSPDPEDITETVDDLYKFDGCNTAPRYGYNQLLGVGKAICRRGLIESHGMKLNADRRLQLHRGMDRTIANILKDTCDLSGLDLKPYQRMLEDLVEDLEATDSIDKLEAIDDPLHRNAVVRVFLQYAIDYSAHIAIRSVIERFGVEAATFDISTKSDPIHRAILDGHSQSVKTLIECGVETVIFESKRLYTGTISHASYDMAFIYVDALKRRHGTTGMSLLLDQCVVSEDWSRLYPPPLYHAIMSMNPYTFSALLTLSTDPNTRFQDWTPLLLATALRLPMFVAILIDRCASISDRMPSKASVGALHLLAHSDPENFKTPPREHFLKQGNESEMSLSQCRRYAEDLILQLLLNAGADVGAKDRFGRTPMDIAMSSGNINMVARLTDPYWETHPELHKDLMLKRDYQSRGFIDYAIEDCNFSLAEKLLTLGADINAISRSGWTALHFSVVTGNDRAVGFCLKNGASCDFNNRLVWSPLLLAVDAAKTKIVRLLLQHGAPAAALLGLSPDGRNAFHMIAHYRDIELFELVVEYYKKYEDHQRSNAPLLASLFSARDIYGRTPLHYACLHGDRGHVGRFLEYASDINCSDNIGNRPIHDCVEAGLFDAVDLLLESHADPNVANYFGLTPLHYAWCKKNAETRAKIVTALMEAGADESVENCDGKTPEDWGLRLVEDRELRKLWNWRIQEEVDRRAAPGSNFGKEGGNLARTEKLSFTGAANGVGAERKNEGAEIATEGVKLDGSASTGVDGNAIAGGEEGGKTEEEEEVATNVKNGAGAEGDSGWEEVEKPEEIGGLGESTTGN